MNEMQSVTLRVPKEVYSAAAGVAQYMVSCRHGLKLVFVAHIAAVLVGVVAHHELPVGALDVGGRGVGGHAQHLVMILTHAGHQTRRAPQKSATRRNIP